MNPSRMPDYSLNWTRSLMFYNAINAACPLEGGQAKARGLWASSLSLIIDTPSGSNYRRLVEKKKKGKIEIRFSVSYFFARERVSVLYTPSIGGSIYIYIYIYIYILRNTLSVVDNICGPPMGGEHSHEGITSCHSRNAKLF